MKIALLSSIARKTPSSHYEPKEKLVLLLSEALIKRGLEVSLFATRDSIETNPEAVVDRGYEEDIDEEIRVAEFLHLANLMEKADQFDLIHNNLDFSALTYSELIKTPLLTTIYSLPSKKIFPIYKRYNQKTFYVACSQAVKHPELDYLATIYPGIDLKEVIFNDKPEDYLLFFGRIHPDEGAREAIVIAQKTGLRLILAGIIQDQNYFEREIAPQLDDHRIRYIGVPNFPEKAQLLASAYALLYPINYEKPFSFTLLEAMASGTPVVAMNRGAVPEIVIDGETGFVVQNLDEAIDKIKEVKYLSRIHCRRLVESRFTLERMVDEYIEIYQKIAEGSLGKGYRGLRPWGRYIVLEEKEKHKVKRIEIHEGMRLSYQRHRRRSEHWFILQGKALVTIDGREYLLTSGEAIDIPAFSLHRIEAKEGKVIFIEIQRGDYLGEDDVERVEDDFGRS